MGFLTPDDTTEAVQNRFAELAIEIGELLPKPDFTFNTRADIDNLTEEQATAIIRLARRNLLMHLLTQEYHEHMTDDCGDYLDAATTLWYEVVNKGGVLDGGDIEGIKEVLLMPEEATDGEFRLDLFSEALQADVWEWEV